MTLTQSDAQLMALKQCIVLSRKHVVDCIAMLENVDMHDLHAARDQISDVILSLKYTTDFILGDPSP